MAKTKTTNKPYVLDPISNYYISDPKMKYTETPVIDFGKLIRDLEIVSKEHCSEKETNPQLYADWCSQVDLWYESPIVPDNVGGSKQKADEKFFAKFPEEYYVTIHDKVLKEDIKVLNYDKLNAEDPTGVKYGSAIREWESDTRNGLTEELGETWLWEDDRTESFKFFTQSFGLFPLRSPVMIPTWMFACNTFNEPFMHLTDIEKVALAHAIHYTTGPYDNGYLEYSGHVERWCRCGVNEVHEAFIMLYRKGLLLQPIYLEPSKCRGLSRNMGWKANIVKLQRILANYGRDVRV